MEAALSVVASAESTWTSSGSGQYASTEFRLPGEFGGLSDGGSVTVYRGVSNGYQVVFYVYRGLLGVEKSFVYSSDGTMPSDIDPVVARLAPNWYLLQGE